MYLYVLLSLVLEYKNLAHTAYPIMEDLVDRWKSFSLTASEELEIDVRVNDKGSLFSSENIKLCVVAKVITNKKINPDAFRSVMKAVWKVHDQTRIELAGENIFVIQFRNAFDKSSVMAEGPWTFDRALVVMVSPNSEDNLVDMRFNKTAFWVQVHNVPFNCMNFTMAKCLGNMIGSVVEIDNDEVSDWTGPFMRIRVVFDILKPLRRGLKVKTTEGKSVWCPILYEKLPDLCFGCGIIGHSLRECQTTVTSNAEKQVFEYGDWMRASILKKSNQSYWDSDRTEDMNRRGSFSSRGRGSSFFRWSGEKGRSDVDRWKSSSSKVYQINTELNENTLEHKNANSVTGGSQDDQKVGSAVSEQELTTEVCMQSVLPTAPVNNSEINGLRSPQDKRGIGEGEAKRVMAIDPPSLTKGENWSKKKYKAKIIQGIVGSEKDDLSPMICEATASGKRKFENANSTPEITKKIRSESTIVNEDKSVVAVHQPRREL